MLEWNQCPAVERVPGKMSGNWLFKGTRIPVTALFENLEDGATVTDFLNLFPGVTSEQVEVVLRFCGDCKWENLIADARPRPKLDAFVNSALSKGPSELLDPDKL